MVLFLFVSLLAAGQGLKTLTLPKPQTTGGKPLMQALSERKTTRSFSEEKIAPQMLSNLLWAADGINRADGRRTAPSPHNSQEIDVYVMTAEGAYLYDARRHALQPVAAGDSRHLAGTQDFVARAPLNLVFVADFARMSGMPDPEKTKFSAASAGFIGQNVYLFGASEGLGVVVRGSLEHSALAKLLKLRPEQHIVLAQTVGYPKK
ncbi:MAG TPA: SagB/ThcOx family dehydrogenase [Bryobacteraceae bacterium]|nr:SagB/ThcOx family dehydrogenase [Bryobacteraceae bacterium]